MEGQIRKRDFRQRIPSHSPARVLACAYSWLEVWEYTDLAMPFWRWYWCGEPGAALLLPSGRVELEPDKFYLVPPMTPFGASTVRPVGQLYLHFELEQAVDAPPGEIFVQSAGTAEKALADRLRELLFSDAPTAEFRTALCAHALLCAGLEAVPAERWRAEPVDARVRDAMAAIRTAFPRAVDNATLARSAGMNESAFVRRFRLSAGLTPHQFLLRLRVQAAAEALLSDALSVEEIAERAGFFDRYHFSRIFHRATGMTPTVFRKTRAGGRTA